MAKGLTEKDLGKFKLVGNIDAFRKKLVFQVTEISIEKDDYFSRLYLYDKKVQPFTSGKKDSNPRFSPDGKLVAFTSKRDKEGKEAELYVIPTDGGEARLLAKFRYGIKNLRFTEDGESIAVVTPVDTEKKPKDDVHVIREIPFWFNGLGWVYGRRNVVYLVDVETGKKKRLTPKNLDVSQIRFHDGKLYFIAQENREKKPMVSDLYVLEGGRAKRLTPGEWSVGDFIPLEDGTFVLSANTRERGIPTNTHIYHYNPETGELRKLTKDLDRSAYNSLNSDVRGSQRAELVFKDGWVYYVATDGPRANLFRVNLEGKIERVVSGDRSVESFAIGDYIAFTAQDAVTPTELYVLRDGKERCVTDFNGWIKEYTLSRPEHFKVKASDGAEIDAWIMKPVGFEPGKKYPAVLEIHGGAKNSLRPLLHARVPRFNFQRFRRGLFQSQGKRWLRRRVRRHKGTLRGEGLPGLNGGR